MDGVAFGVGEEWRGRLCILDPAQGDRHYRRLDYLQAAVQQTGPALFSLHVLQRLHRHAGELARAQVARELHDGVIQSLVGLEMQLAVLCRDSARTATDTAAQVDRVRQLLQQEIRNVRTLMRQLRPPSVAPTRLVAHLNAQVETFSKETGIHASFTTTVTEVRLPPRICRELALIVREALANVRKHSGAGGVIVRLEPGRLAVTDDGRGFGFTGELSMAELDERHVAPAMIRESVRAIGGTLIVESAPNRGARIEVRFPETLRWANMVS